MINNPKNVSFYTGCSPPTNEQDNGRKISGGPLYVPQTVDKIAAEGRLQLWSKGAIRDGQKWSLDTKDIARLLREALDHGKFLESEWCVQKPAGPWAACDAYRVTATEWNDVANKEMSVVYYLKVAISRTGTMLLSISNHPEGT